MKQILVGMGWLGLGLGAIACAPSANPPRATPESPKPQESSAPMTQIKPPQETPTVSPSSQP
jgi:hypothetical protein